MDNLSTDSKGNANVDIVVERATLGDGAATDILGKAVIVHIAPDDYKTQPSGGSGARVACGVITAG
jgi:Cu-Zn family superoxide dismutase